MRVAQILNRGTGAQPQAGRNRRRDDLDGAVHEAGSAEPLKEKIAGEIITARPQRLQRRLQLRLDLDECAGRRRGAALDRQPHALRLVGDARAVDAIDAQNKTVGLLAFLAQLDKTVSETL